jgi:hypothetical protein
MVAYNTNKASYNKTWRECHVDYYRQKSREHYQNNITNYQLKNALYRFRQGKTVGPDLIEKLRKSKLIV